MLSFYPYVSQILFKYILSQIKPWLRNKQCLRSKMVDFVELFPIRLKGFDCPNLIIDILLNKINLFPEAGLMLEWNYRINSKIKRRFVLLLRKKLWSWVISHRLFNSVKKHKWKPCKAIHLRFYWKLVEWTPWIHLTLLEGIWEYSSIVLELKGNLSDHLMQTFHYLELFKESWHSLWSL